MESDRRRSWIQLVAFLALFSFFSAAGGSPLEVMSAPNLLRVESAENVFVEVQDNVQAADIPVQITVMNHPTQTSVLASTSVTLTRANHFQGFGTIKIPAEEFSKDPNKKQYVYLQAQFPNHLLEKVVLVSFQSGHIFIQTDKSIYSPDSNVNYRIFAVNPSMEPQTNTLIDVEMMTPDGSTVESTRLISRSRMLGQSFTLPAIVSHGLWKMVAKFRSNPQQIFTAEFEVNDYVLPNFEVKLIPSSPFFYMDSDALTVNIRARYVFGKEVEGSAFAVFGVFHDGDKKNFPSSLQRVSIENGNGVVTLTKEHISQTFPNIPALVGSSMFVTVSVLTDNGGEMVEKELRDIKIITSRYTINFKKTPQFFKPGMVLDVTVQVLNPDNTPAQGVTVVLNPGNQKSLTTTDGTAKLTVNIPQSATVTVTAVTDDATLPSQKQASASMTALPYTTKSRNYLHISVDSAQVKLGENIRVNFYLRSQGSEQKDLTYLILSRGQLVKHERYTTRGQTLVAVVLRITKEMLPSFRIVAYYHPTSDEVVADSVWVDVKDSCMGSLTLDSGRPIRFYEPRKLFSLRITGDPEAIVGIGAVDKRVHVLNQNHQLTQKKIWDSVEEYDTGCTAGGGRDSMSVFYDAGLLFETSTVPGTPYRTELKCPTSSRKKRATTIIQSNTTIDNQHKNKEQRECYLNGLKNIFASYTCEKQSKLLVNGSARVEAFMRCCQDMEQQKVRSKERTPLLARSKRQAQDWDDAYLDRNDIVSRSLFPESWLWAEQSLNACPQNSPSCASTSSVKNVPLRDSITTWHLTGISLSKTHGICVADLLEVVVRKEFFIDLSLPYSAVHGEQMEIKAIIYNNAPDAITVRLDLKEVTDVCSAAYNKHWYHQEVQVGAHTSQSVPFIIIPMKTGEVFIEVKAAVKDSYLSDGIIKILHVVPKGVLANSTMNLTLDPASKGGKQVETIDNEISTTDLIPNTPTSTSIFLKGREQMSTLLVNPISGVSMGALIREPMGSGESNIAGMTLPVIATIYLDKTNQWEAVGLEKRREAVQHIKRGYQNELAFHKSDGSFAVFSQWNSATWLTAYVAKVFFLAHNLVSMDSNVICGAIRYLILNTQQPDGAFREVGNMFDKNMIGDVGGVDSDASMTAFCLIAMQESRTICSTTPLSSSISKAVTYLERRLPRLTNAYAVAMTSYALANENKLNKMILYTFAAPDRSHWPVSKGGVYSLEATAYALLALVKDQAFEDAKPVVRWLSQQQRTGGNYGSTQATIMVYQALAEYFTNVREQPFDMNVDISVPGRPWVLRFNNDNVHTTWMIKVNSIHKDIQVTATGTGNVMLQAMSHYYAQPSKQEGDCELFDLNVELLQVKAEDFRTYNLRIQVLYKNREHNAAMSVLDIGLPGGYTINKDDLNSVSNRTNYIIAKDKTDVSERRSVIIYLKTVSNTQPEEISFRIQQKVVYKMQPVAVSVYEYNNKKHCVKFYNPERESEKLLTHCFNDECICAEGKCCKQKTGQISDEERTAKACESTPTNKIDHVYKVRLEAINAGPGSDIYTMRIQKVIKEGYAVANEGKLQSYLSFQHCRRVLNLKKGQTYLIMATFPQFKTGGNIPAILNEDTWVEYWPTDEECQIDVYRPTCIGLNEMQLQMETFGCEL